mmetsp:Transcript_9016/g.22000  ORF Transcript_9016/g.22000 Transcript_9016/m.22000 type:complete len:113 (+) Transcript_9016:1156-1494(+)
MEGPVLADASRICISVYTNSCRSDTKSKTSSFENFEPGVHRSENTGRVIPPREANRNSAKSKPDGDAEANKAYHRYRNNCPALKYVFDEWHDVDAGASIQHVGEEIAEVLGI